MVTPMDVELMESDANKQSGRNAPENAENIPLTAALTGTKSVASVDAAVGGARPSFPSHRAAEVGEWAATRGERAAGRRQGSHSSEHGAGGGADVGVVGDGDGDVNRLRRQVSASDTRSRSPVTVHDSGRAGTRGAGDAGRPEDILLTPRAKPTIDHSHYHYDDNSGGYDEHGRADGGERSPFAEASVAALAFADDGVKPPENLAEVGAVNSARRFKWASRVVSFLSVMAFWLSHTASVYATKSLLSRPGRTARSVVLITWCQCTTSWCLVLFLGTLGERLDVANSKWHPRLMTELARALPTNALLGGWNSKSLLGGGAAAVGVASVLFSLAVFSDNACLGVVNASFFQVARALTLPFVTCMGALAKGSPPPRDLILPCVLCVLGFALGVHCQTPEAFADGTSLGVLASLLTAAYTLLLARAEPREAWRVTYVTNRNASVLFVPVAVYVGLGDPSYLSGDMFLLKDGATMLLAFVVAVLPAVAGVSTMWQAQAGLGARGQAASFVGRAACAHLLAYRVFGNSPVPVGEAGCCLVLAGLALYASRRGGAAVAQAGNVAVPGAARDHFLFGEGDAAADRTAGNATEGGGRFTSIKRKTSDKDIISKWLSPSPVKTRLSSSEILHDEEIRTGFGDGLRPGKVDENTAISSDDGMIARHAPRDHPDRAWYWSRRQGGAEREIEPRLAPGRTTERSFAGLSLVERMKYEAFGFWRGSVRALARESELDLDTEDEEAELFKEQEGTVWRNDCDTPSCARV